MRLLNCAFLQFSNLYSMFHYLTADDGYLVWSTWNSDKKDYEQAIAYYESAETLFRQKSTPILEAEVLLNKGKAQLNSKAFEKAQKTLKKAVRIAKQQQLSPILSSSLIQLGKTLHQLNYLGKKPITA